MPATHYTLDAFVSQELSRLTACAPQSLATEFPLRSQWLDRFVLQRIINDHVREGYVPLAFIVVRRAEAAVDEWELACASAHDVRCPSGYFRMLRHLENCIAALWQGMDFCRKVTGKNLFEKSDDTFYRRLNEVYNCGRHFNPSNIPRGDLHGLWISNDGLHSRNYAITFFELFNALRDLARAAEMLSGLHRSASGFQEDLLST